MSLQSIDERPSDGVHMTSRTRSCGDGEYSSHVLSPQLKALLHRQASLPPSISRRPPHYPRTDFPLSPMSSHSFTSFSGSLSTQEQPSPRTPEFGQSPTTIIARPNETPITAFLSQFYDAESSPRGVHSRLSAGESGGDLYGDMQADGKLMWPQLQTAAAECQISRILDVPSPVSTEDPSALDSSSEYSPSHPPLPSSRKARRFARGIICTGSPPMPHSGEPADKPDVPQPAVVSRTLVVSTEGKVLPVTNDPSVLPSQEKSPSELPFPPATRPTPGPLSESETRAVQEFLKQWGARQRAPRDRKCREVDSPPPENSGNVPPTSLQPRESSIDEFSWEAKDFEGEEDSGLDQTTRCSTLLHEASLMVGLSSDTDLQIPDDPVTLPQVPNHVGMETRDRRDPNLTGMVQSPARVPVAPQIGTPEPLRVSHRQGRIYLKDHIAIIPGTGPPSPQNSPNDNALGFAQKRDVYQKSDNLDIAPECNWERSRLDACGSPRSPQTLLRPKLPPALIPRYRSAEPIRPCSSAHKRQGQIFQLNNPIESRTNQDIAPVFTHPRDAPMPVLPTKPLPPTPTPPPAKRVSALDRLESSLVRLKAHAPGHHQKSQSSGTQGATKRRASTKGKRPSLPSVLSSQRKDTPSTHSRHFSNPMPHPIGPPWAAAEGIEVGCGSPPFNTAYVQDSYCDVEKPVRAHISSFMDMDASEKPAQAQRGSLRNSVNKDKMKKFARAAARLSQGVIAWGKNLTGSKKSSASTTS